MDVSKIPTGKAPPQDINVVVEIPQGSAVKYEIDKASGAIFVDRFLFTATAYPSAYGFIPGTLAEDGDPADALVLIPAQVVPGAVVRSRPIGMLRMEGRGRPGRKDHLRAARTAASAIHDRGLDRRPAAHHPGGDRAFLPELQGSGTRQVGQDHRLGRPRRGRGGDREGRRRRALSNAGGDHAKTRRSRNATGSAAPPTPAMIKNTRPP
jgi:inorganic pyrophosphatase